MIAVCTALCLTSAIRVEAESTGPRPSILGSVQNTAGRPLEGVRVLVTGTPVETLSQADGTFEILGLTPGRYSLEARSPEYVIETIEAVVTDGASAEVSFRMTAAEVVLAEIEVVSKFSILEAEPTASTALDREQIMKLPHFGDDLYRAVTVLPSVAAGDISGRFTVRGGLHREVLVLLDGLELIEPFHLKDFQGLFTILDTEVMGGVDLIPSTFPVEYGDRMSSVLDMTTADPAAGAHLNLGISFSNAWLGGSSTFADGKGRVLGSLRRGYLDVLLKLGEEENDDEELSPRYWDAFSKVEFDLSPRHSLAIKVLAADDALTLTEIDDGDEVDVETAYGSSYAWLAHRALFGTSAFVDTLLSISRVDADRSVLAFDPDGPEFLELTDHRVLDLRALKQSWNVQPTTRHYLKFGFEIRDYETNYDYFNTQLIRNRIDDPRFPAEEITTVFDGRFESENFSLWAADRLRPGARLTAEIGLRWDDQTLRGDSQLSPRLNLVYRLGQRTVMRAGWGQFHQSQRPHELEVPFGEETFFDAERAEHWSLGFEQELGQYSLRADAYRREIRNPRPRYETLFDPFSPIPEFSSDLVQIAADKVTSEGVEILVRRPGSKLGWWASYVLSSAEDRIDDIDVKRSFDQTHAVTLNVSYRPSRKWDLNWVWTYHTGWPTTALSADYVPTDGGFEIVHHLGPFYAERLDDYHRLDLRASRSSQLKRSELTFFVDVQNLYGRENIRGLDIENETLLQQPDGSTSVAFPEEARLGLTPSLGISWRF